MINNGNLSTLDNYGDVLTIPELAKILRVGRNTAYSLVNSGEIKSVRVRNQIRIPKSSILEYLG
ncbi:MAG TPA: helix-turn-helix domain-containing protein [Clostridiales bacterium]|jgi:excisionase family DNA binding protein|nr:helix-turn-helix domain-containing protein [Clostridiales bacterium]